MKVDMDRVVAYQMQNHQAQFMKAQDYATRTKKSDAEEIYKFLNNKELQTKRQEELTAYLLDIVDEKGNRKFTADQAVDAAKLQVENEKSQMNAQITQVFVDEASYNKALEEAKKNGTDKIYNFNLIKDKNLLAYINANEDKFYDVDASGKKVFSSDKFKAEFGQDVGTDNKLQLLERENAANRRTISKTAEKNAIKASGLDYRHDNTGLYRTVAASAALAALGFGVFAKATADAVTLISSAHASARAVSAGLVGAGAAGLSIPFIHDKDGKTNKRQDAADLYAQKPKQDEVEPKVEPKTEPKVEPKTEPKVEPKTEPKTKEQVDEPCFDVVTGVPVKTIRFGGYWHYANLYNDCKTGKKLNDKQIAELTQLLKPGHEGTSMQKGDSWKTMTLMEEITLSDGTKVCLADEKERERRVSQMKTRDGKTNNLRLEDKRDIMIPCIKPQVAATA